MRHVSRGWSMCVGIACLIAAVNTSHATDKNNRYFAYGLGQKRCEDYINFRDKKLDALQQKYERYTQEELYEIVDKVVEQWIAGFLTAHNLYVSDTYNVAGTLTMDDFKARLDSACRANTKQYFSEAMVDLVQKINPDRTKVEPGK